MEHKKRGRIRLLGGSLGRGKSTNHAEQMSFDHGAELPPPRLRLTPKSRLGRFFSRHKLIKRVSLISTGALLLSVALLATRFYLVAHKIIVKGNTAAALTENVNPNLLKGEGDGRVNILLIGIGGPNHPGGDLSDTIMVVSLDPLSHDVTMLSIPRDLYVPIPGHGSAKINAAHAYGDEERLGSGPGLLEQTIEQNLGIPIHYYIRLDFDAFKEAVNTVGGIDIKVPQALYDPFFPDPQLKGYQPLYIAAGQQHMNGDTALKYVRSRETTSDFDRSHRQQLVLLALKQKVLGISTLANPIKLNSLLQTLGNHLQTDISISDALKLYDISKQIQPNQITQAALTNAPNNYLASETINGQSVLVPRSGNFTDIKRYVRSLMPDGYIKREGATISLLNGTDRPDLAKQTATILRSYGYQVVAIGNAATKDYTQTLIYDHSNGNKPYTVHYLEKRFSAQAQAQIVIQPTSDITIILGSNYTPVD